jgi:hypothetical protein
MKEVDMFDDLKRVNEAKQQEMEDARKAAEARCIQLVQERADTIKNLDKMVVEILEELG